MVCSAITIAAADLFLEKVRVGWRRAIRYVKRLRYINYHFAAVAEPQTPLFSLSPKRPDTNHIMSQSVMHMSGLLFVCAFVSPAAAQNSEPNGTIYIFIISIAIFILVLFCLLCCSRQSPDANKPPNGVDVNDPELGNEIVDTSLLTSLSEDARLSYERARGKQLVLTTLAGARRQSEISNFRRKWILLSKPIEPSTPIQYIFVPSLSDQLSEPPNDILSFSMIHCSLFSLLYSNFTSIWISLSSMARE